MFEDDHLESQYEDVNGGWGDDYDGYEEDTSGYYCPTCEVTRDPKPGDYNLNDIPECWECRTELEED